MMYIFLHDNHADVFNYFRVHIMLSSNMFEFRFVLDIAVMKLSVSVKEWDELIGKNDVRESLEVLDGYCANVSLKVITRVL